MDWSQWWQYQLDDDRFRLGNVTIRAAAKDLFLTMTLLVNWAFAGRVRESSLHQDTARRQQRRDGLHEAIVPTDGDFTYRG